MGAPSAPKKAVRKRTTAAKKTGGAAAEPENPAAKFLQPPDDEGVLLDLDALDKTDWLPDAITTPYKFRHASRVYELADPRDIDWRDLITGLRNPALFMANAMNEDDQAAFQTVKTPGWKLDAIFSGWQAHYKVTGLGDLSALLNSAAR